MMRGLFFWLENKVRKLSNALNEHIYKFNAHLKNPKFKNEPLAPDMELSLDRIPPVDNTTIGEIEFGHEDNGFWGCSRIWSSYYNIANERCGYLRFQTLHNKNSILGLAIEPSYDDILGWYNKINLHNNLLKNPMYSISNHTTKVGEIMVEINGGVYYIPIYS